MRRRLSFVLAAALAASFPLPILAQQAGFQKFGGGKPGIPGTAIGGVKPGQIPLATGKARFGVGTGGIGQGAGNATGGINGATRAGSGGIGDLDSLGSLTGGIQGTGRGLNAVTGGIKDAGSLGENTGGIEGSRIGAGTGGTKDLNSLGATTGGFGEQNAPRIPAAK
ncbi:MAG TPA: hypothetical protein VKE72_07710 [Methylocella sp.]|nr:hypothetical protein [Methylocella sp.]